MNIVENIVTNGHGSLSPSYICIHETANPGATAANHVSYWKNNPDYAVHYVGDWTGTVYHTVPDDRLCWQIGNGNSYVLGIELCHAQSSSDFTKVWDTGIEWAVYMLNKKGWGIDRLISHNEARQKWGGTDHTDPDGYFEEFGKTWSQFKSEVKSKLSGSSSSSSSSGSSGSSSSGSSTTKKDSSAIHFRVCTNSNGKNWLSEMWGHYDTGGSSDDFAGITGTAIRWIAIKGVSKYQVAVKKSSGVTWLPYVSGYDITDLNNGCAGDGNPIVGLRVNDSKARYAVHVINGKTYSDMIGLKDTGGSSDDYAGDLKNSIDRLYMNWA